MTVVDAVGEIERTRLLVIVRVAAPADHIPAALETAGVRTLEVSLLSESARATITRWRERHPRLTIGAGTVLSDADAASAIDAGAQFVVSPGLHEDVAARAAEASVDYLPGALTPAECHRCAVGGARLIKLFPAEPLGPGYLKALGGPFPDLHLMPTGGVGLANAAAYLRAGAAALAVGSELVNDTVTTETIEQRARALIGTIVSIDKGDT